MNETPTEAPEPIVPFVLTREDVLAIYANAQDVQVLRKRIDRLDNDVEVLRKRVNALSTLNALLSATGSFIAAIWGK